MIIIAENRIWNNENRISKFEIEKTSTWKDQGVR